MEMDQPGEFTKLFEEVLNTVDLIFRDGIDWKAFVNAFEKLQVKNGDTELYIKSSAAPLTIKPISRLHLASS